MTLEIDSPQSPLRLTFPAGRAAIVHCRRGLDAREPSQQKKVGGTAQPIEKARFGQADPKSKTIPLLGFAWAWLGFVGF
jgi:hypothetical protein